MKPAVLLLTLAALAIGAATAFNGEPAATPGRYQLHTGEVTLLAATDAGTGPVRATLRLDTATGRTCVLVINGTGKGRAVYWVEVSEPIDLPTPPVQSDKPTSSPTHRFANP